MTRYEIQKKLHVTQEQKNKVETAVLDCIMMAKKRFPNSNIPFPEIRYDLVGKAAGQAIYQMFGKPVHTIRINPILLNENENRVIEQTVPHEMAHVVVHQVWHNEMGSRVKGHGYEWQSVMRTFGLAPNRCHNMDVSSIQMLKNTTEYKFTCNCIGRVYSLSKNKYNRWRGGTVYTCRRCGGELRFDRSVKNG